MKIKYLWRRKYHRDITFSLLTWISPLTGTEVDFSILCRTPGFSDRQKLFPSIVSEIIEISKVTSISKKYMYRILLSHYTAVFYQSCIFLLHCCILSVLYFPITLPYFISLVFCLQDSQRFFFK